jgi:hypothetical protein
MAVKRAVAIGRCEVEVLREAAPEQQPDHERVERDPNDRDEQDSPVDRRLRANRRDDREGDG